MRPVSSDTITATASFSSVSPIAARCRVPRFLRELRIDRQRQKAGGRRDAIVLHDDGAVVQRRFRLKDAHEQIVGEHRVERKPRLDVVAQADLPLDDDDRARPRGRQLRRRDRDLFDRLLGAFLRQEISEERRAAEVRERAADVGLKQHDGGKHDDRAAGCG